MRWAMSRASPSAHHRCGGRVGVVGQFSAEMVATHLRRRNDEFFKGGVSGDFFTFRDPGGCRVFGHDGDAIVRRPDGLDVRNLRED